jgi:hypothetical protein
MKKKGYSYRDPLAAVGDVQWRSSVSGQAEMATATADVQCKISTNLVGVAQAVQAATDEIYIERHTTALASFKSKLQGEIAAAGQVG